MKTSPMSVQLVDSMGSDLTVVNAARVSFDKESYLDFEEVGHPASLRYFLKDKDAKLINYLAKHNHWSPFAHTSIQLRVKAPIFVGRQLVKHQVGGVWNEVSRRYVDSEPEFWFPEVWRGRPVNAKQGSSGVVDSADTVLTAMSFHEDLTVTKLELWPQDSVQLMVDHYNHMLKAGVAPEQARMILPQNMQTEWYWTGSLMFFCRVCRERLAPGAQQETREVAEQIAEIVAPLFPVSWSALMNSEG
jgi:thymidylate synthase (FAD)